MSNPVFTVLQCIVIISTIIIMRYVIPFLRIKLQSLIDDEVFNEVMKAVKSVEQDKEFVFGTCKKEEVLNRIVEWANARGIVITVEQISALIETAVWVMKNEDKINE